MALSIRPLHDNVVIRRFDPERVSKGGIVLADTAQERNLQGEVLAVGEGRVSDTGAMIVPRVKVGDRVLIMKYAGNEVELDGEKYLLVRATEIAGVLEPQR